ncbi:FtsX-like permease family protein [Clostridium sp. C8-1-8]|uniref:ABC transporter permease n=1 Tax=Clostridium sp. C8-1-8 TaxID=2698831 RepID=UPI00136E1373|nr:FtsX-like permease family protein [Clostridium sp. C8-1-8]
MNYIKSKNISLIVMIIYFVIALCISLTVGKIADVIKQSKALNWYVTDNAVSVAMVDKINYEDLISTMSEKGTVIEKNLVDFYDDEDKPYEGVALYFNSKLSESPSILKGRFLNSDDFSKAEGFAVIGKNLLKNTIEKDGSRIFVYEKKQYKVIGICGDDNKDVPDNNRFYINVNYYMKGLEHSNDIGWVFDNIYGKRDFISKLESGLNVKIDERDVKALNTKSLVINGMRDKKSNLINTAVVLITLIITLVNTSFFWFGKRRKEIAVRKLCGGTNKRIIINLMLSYIGQAIFASMLAVFTHWIINTLKTSTSLLQVDGSVSLINIVVLILSSLIIGSITIIFLLLDILKLECNDMMRRSRV